MFLRRCLCQGKTIRVPVSQVSEWKDMVSWFIIMVDLFDRKSVEDDGTEQSELGSVEGGVEGQEGLGASPSESGA